MKISKELISESEIQSKINEIGAQINEDYDGQDLLIIGILKGAFITISDLAKRLKVDVSFDFMSVSSYEGTETSGQVKIEKDLDIDISGKNILIVEDIFDTGLTLSYLKKILDSRNPKSLEFMCMFIKDTDKTTSIDIKYHGFKIGPEFVVGYGLDFEGKYRELPYLAVLS